MRRNSHGPRDRRILAERTTREPMSPRPEPSTQEVLAGLVERVTYHNAENGFCVLRARARGHRDVVTVVGHAASISAGEWITASGDWVNDRTHGQQFKARFLHTSPPTSADGIEKCLSPGMIRGVGPVYAKNKSGKPVGRGQRSLQVLAPNIVEVHIQPVGGRPQHGFRQIAGRFAWSTPISLKNAPLSAPPADPMTVCPLILAI